MKREKKINLVKQHKPKDDVPLQFWEEMAQEIINSKCNNSSKIELNFEELIPCLSNKKIRNIYIQLLEYYKKIDSEGAAYYWELYDNDFIIDSGLIVENSLVFEDLEGEDFFYD